jgi:hypothetical protein
MNSAEQACNRMTEAFLMMTGGRDMGRTYLAQKMAENKVIKRVFYQKSLTFELSWMYEKGRLAEAVQYNIKNKIKVKSTYLH